MDDRRVAAVVAAVLVGCSGPAAVGPAKPSAGSAGSAATEWTGSGLPPSTAVSTERFASVGACARCHTGGTGDGPGSATMRDARGGDISPVTQADASIMALSARDPYYLAALQRELEHVPATTTEAAATALCVRCHAPVGFQEARATGGTLGLAELERATTPAAVLGREGVGCAGCHALAADGLGSDATLDGLGTYRLDRVSFGAQPTPADDAMRAMIHQAVVSSPHVDDSALCASCHTVIVPAVAAGSDGSAGSAGDDIVEQATYLEWRASAFAQDGGETCQGCHLEALNAPTPFATRPPTSPARDGYRQHAIRGGNAYLLARLAAHTDGLGAAATPEQLGDAAADTAAFLTTAAKLDVAPVAGGVAVTVTNLTGHKLPTGYPTRRMWLHVVARGGDGAVVLESGRAVAGAIVGTGGKRLDARGVVMRHVDRVASADDVAVWEAVPIAADGHRTHLLLGTARIAKDDRILPAGFAPTGSDVARTRPIGVAGDRDFLPGRDTVTIAVPAGIATVDVELLYQAIPPETLESYSPNHPEAARFLAVADLPPEPQVIARAAWKR
jgi:hypothetical protein|nr:hypothetical protein [Kofleriaceae bacterium]